MAYQSPLRKNIEMFYTSVKERRHTQPLIIMTSHLHGKSYQLTKESDFPAMVLLPFLILGVLTLIICLSLIIQASCYSAAPITDQSLLGRFRTSGSLSTE